MKSLYGSTTSRAVIVLSYAGVFTVFPPAFAESSRFQPFRNVDDDFARRLTGFKVSVGLPGGRESEASFVDEWLKFARVDQRGDLAQDCAVSLPAYSCQQWQQQEYDVQ